MSKGWFYDSYRHSLASKGIKTAVNDRVKVLDLNAKGELLNAKGESSDVSEDDFKAYVRVQMSGATNMFDVDTVSSLSGLPKDKIFKIMDSYDNLSKKYPGVLHAKGKSGSGDDTCT